MTKIAGFLIGVMVIVLVGGIIPSTEAATAPVSYANACDLMNDPMWDGWYEEKSISTSGLMFYAGDTVYITAGSPDGIEVMPEAIYYVLDGATVATGPYPGSMTWTAPADMTVSQFAVETDGWAWIPWTASCSTGGSTSGGPGCDVLMKIPETAVVGAFVQTAPLHWTPDHLISPYTELTSGKTAWVLGQDASRAYYKIIWGCQYLWVPVSTLGPNYDALWQGKPLPVDIVE